MRGRGPRWECAWSVQGTAWDAVRLGRGWEMAPARELLPDPRGTLGSDGGMLVDVVKAEGAPKHGFCFYMKHEVRAAAESEGGTGEQGVEEGHGEKRRYSIIIAENEKEISRKTCWDCWTALRVLGSLWSWI